MTQNSIDIASDGVKILPVSDFLDYVTYVLQITEQVKVIGEISSLTHHPSGVYMTLKDGEREAILECYISHFAYRGMGLVIEQGMQVIISGSAGIYKPKGKLSFRVETVEPVGEGSLKRAYELLKQKLDEEGLFARKRELPQCIQTIGVVTSKTGAVIDDFLNNLEKRGYKVILSDTRVEGRLAESSIVQSINQLLKLSATLDCLVLMRGGGSLEDLQAFNSEAVVRALFSSKIPTIAAIGHDRDVPLVCLAADNFTSTPTAAAVLVNSTWQSFENSVTSFEQSILNNFEENLNHQTSQLSNLTSSLLIHAKHISTTFQRLSESFSRSVNKLEIKIKSISVTSSQFLSNIIKAQEESLNKVKNKIEDRLKFIESVSPERQLKLGYSITRNKPGKIIRKIEDTAPKEELIIQLSNGDIITEVK
jgi:exodeoxyribonuclease VII large subunit